MTRYGYRICGFADSPDLVNPEMDKFVTRKPGHSFSRGKPKPPEKKKTQATIEQLGGVVVVEDIMRHKARLQSENQSSTILLESLRELGKKIPCKKVLISSKIGHIVNKLRKHEDPEVNKAAKQVYTKWRTYYKDLKDCPQIEVKYDRTGEEMRTSGRKFLAKELGLEEGANLVEMIEREVVHACNRRLDKSYRRTMRTLVFTLKHKHDVKKDVLSGKLSVEEFVKGNKKC